MALTAAPVPALAGPLSTTDWPSSAGWPLAGVPVVVSDFAPPPKDWQSGHRGTDLAARVGQAVHSSAAGLVSFAGQVGGKPTVVISHGRLRTTYQPVSASVRKGERVQMGQQIGRLTAGSHCLQACLHWGLKQGERYLDPTLLPTHTLGASTDPRLVPQSAMAKAAAAELAASAAASVAGAGGAGGAVVTGRAGSHGFVPPVRGPVTSKFGPRFHPVLKRWKLHDGTDYGAACGTPIVASYDGVVRQRYFNAGYGNRLIIDHGTVDGSRIATAYNHATGYSVTPGQKVRRGQVVGQVGTTGYSTGCHLHLMVWANGSLINPQTWM